MKFIQATGIQKTETGYTGTLSTKELTDDSQTILQPPIKLSSMSMSIPYDLLQFLSGTQTAEEFEVWLAEKIDGLVALGMKDLGDDS